MGLSYFRCHNVIEMCVGFHCEVVLTRVSPMSIIYLYHITSVKKVILILLNGY